jgi:histone H3
MAQIKSSPRRNPVAQASFDAWDRQLIKLKKARNNQASDYAPLSPNLRVLQEIRKFQGTFNLLHPLRTFQCLVKEIASGVSGNYRFQSTALLALQDAAEAFVIRFFKEAQFCSFHCNSKTVTPVTPENHQMLLSEQH